MIAIREHTDIGTFFFFFLAMLIRHHPHEQEKNYLYQPSKSFFTLSYFSGRSQMLTLYDERANISAHVVVSEM